MSERGLKVRLFVSCWVVLTLHFATNVVREHYPALALAEAGTLAVDEYVGLHPDIFVAPTGRAYINNNPGASVLASVPLLVFRPALRAAETIARRRLPDAPDDVSAVYADARPNRVRFYREARRRGLDLKFGVAAFVTVAFLMSPLTALAAVVMFSVLRTLRYRAREALPLAFLFVFATPMFFRNGHLNQNLVLGVLSFFAFVLLWRAPGRQWPRARWDVGAAGLLAGAAVTCDYSAVVLFAFLAVFAAAKGSDAGTMSPEQRGGSAARYGVWFAAGAIPPVAALFFYQWLAFGHPFRPAQAVMPPTVLSGAGVYGLAWPAADLLWANLFDPRFGLFAYGPLLLLAIPGWCFWPPPAFTLRDRLLLAALFAGFLIFCSANQFARLQWNTGVRYMVPLVPFLFLFVAGVLRRLGRGAGLTLGVIALAHSWALAMVRESVPESLARVATDGWQLPWLTVLGKMAVQYPLGLKVLSSPLPVLAACTLFLIVLWRTRERKRQVISPAW